MKKLMIVCFVLPMLLACTAWAGMQHLVAPGESWDTLSAKVQPGDEIILMPGRHKPAVFEKLQGTKDAPITIRGLDPENPAVIGATRHGILITDPKYITIENLEITGASIAGIALRSLPKVNSAASSEGDSQLNAAHVRLRNVTITKIGPNGRRDALEILGQDQVSVEKCKFEGWGGAAIAILASSNIRIDDCRFKALADHSQIETILLRTGVNRVDITNCRFELGGAPAITAGGKSDPAAFQPAIADDAKAGSVFEARQIQIMHCLFLDAQAPIVMRSADAVLVRACTFVRPRACMVMIEHQHDDPRFAVSARLDFGDNIVVWNANDLLIRVAVGDERYDLRNITYDRNVWWSDETPEQRAKLGEFQGGLVSDQIVDVDPKLDDAFKPTNPDVQNFGAFAE